MYYQFHEEIRFWTRNVYPLFWFSWLHHPLPYYRDHYFFNFNYLYQLHKRINFWTRLFSLTFDFLDFIFHSIIIIDIIHFVTIVIITFTSEYTFRQGLFSLIICFLEFIINSLITTFNISFNKFMYINLCPKMIDHYSMMVRNKIFVSIFSFFQVFNIQGHIYK